MGMTEVQLECAERWRELLGGVQTEVEPGHQPQSGWSVSVDWGKWYTAPSVNGQQFGPHRYGQHGTGPCACGCSMSVSSSSGPVDPFGACPANPKNDAL